MRHILTLLTLTACAWANQIPKVFVETEAISLIDPLKHGFHVVFYPEFVAHYLNPARLPTIYVSAIPLRESQKPLHRMMYREDIMDNMIKVDNLEEKSWYYICVEFENVVRHHNRGNTSTTCKIARTLDNFGKSESTIVSDDYKISHVGDTSMEFQVRVDTMFPLQIWAYLEHGSAPVQTYIVSQPKSLRIQFPLLSPGFNYGKLCIIEDPLFHPYTMMGRTVHTTITTCHLGDLKTKDSPKMAQIAMADEPFDRPQARSLRNDVANSASVWRSVKTTDILGGGVILCIVLNILMPAIPLLYMMSYARQDRL